MVSYLKQLGKQHFSLILEFSNHPLQTAPDDYIDVRVFLEPDSILEKVSAELEAKGMKIRTIIEGPDVQVRGSIAVKNLNDINAVAEVYRIEHDHVL